MPSPCRSTQPPWSTTPCGSRRATAPPKSDGPPNNSRPPSSIPRSPPRPICTCIGNSGSARFAPAFAICICAGSATDAAGSGLCRFPSKSNLAPMTVAAAGSVRPAVSGSPSPTCPAGNGLRNYLSGDGAKSSSPGARFSADLLLLGDDLILDLVVRGLGNDLLLHQLVLPLVGTAVDDLLRVGVTDAGKSFQFIL